LIFLFDLDDTLLDDDAAQKYYLPILFMRFKKYIHYDAETFYQVWREVLPKYHKQYANGMMSFEEQRVLRVKESFNNWTLSDEVLAEVVGSFDSLFCKSWKLMDDAVWTLTQMHKFKKGIITNGSGYYQDAKIERMGIRHFFDCIIISEHAGAAKPKKGIFDLACGKLNCIAQDCFFVGNSWDTDVVGSALAGMTPIWLNRYREPIPEPINGLLVIEKLADILKLIN
jgi:putative hydrolase of the HAD superfamily